MAVVVILPVAVTPHVEIDGVAEVLHGPRGAGEFQVDEPRAVVRADNVLAMAIAVGGDDALRRGSVSVTHSSLLVSLLLYAIDACRIVHWPRSYFCGRALQPRLPMIHRRGSQSPSRQKLLQ